MTLQKTSKRSFMRLWLLAAGIVLVAALIIGWMLVREDRTPVYKGKVESISTGLIGQYAALVVIADEQGYFDQHGLNVQISEYESGPAAIAAMHAGTVDTAMGADFAAALGGLRGEDIKILATLSKAEAFSLVGREDHGIARVRDFAGKKIGITPKTVGEFYLGQFLTFNNLKRTEVQLVDMTQPDLLDALSNGYIDAAVLFEPNAYQARQRLGHNGISWSVQSGQSIYSSLYGTADLVAKRPAVLKRYMQALVLAEAYMRDHPAESKRIIADYFDYSDDYIGYVWPKFDFSLSLDQELLLNMDDEARWAIENGLVSGELPDFSTMLYFEALEAAKPEGITVIR